MTISVHMTTVRGEDRQLQLFKERDGNIAFTIARGKDTPRTAYKMSPEEAFKLMESLVDLLQG